MSSVTLSNHARTERATNRGSDVYPFWDANLNNLYSRLIPLLRVTRRLSPA
ncbi:uncharacterized protein UHOD_11068 [Ustilago sp. UG-2017b]|nr:uncharacterized protein UHOD_11068 [Ustilago sp. UG-2017b]